MPDPVGGREAEIEAEGLEAALQAYWFSTRVADGSTTFRDDMRAAIAAYLSAVRSSGSAAQNQEDEITRLREQIAWTVERCNEAMGDGFKGTPNSAVAAVCDALLAARSPQDEDQEEKP